MRCVVLLPKGNGRDVYPRLQVNGRAVCVARALCVVCARRSSLLCHFVAAAGPVRLGGLVRLPWLRCVGGNRSNFKYVVDADVNTKEHMNVGDAPGGVMWHYNLVLLALHSPRPPLCTRIQPFAAHPNPAQPSPLPGM